MITKLQVEDIIKKRWTSLKDPKELISLYSIEKQTNQGYNGRQLLELFQNCEDEGASMVEIFLDTETCSLTISNDGPKPFSLKGYDSVFYPGLSSKVSSGYIGNKGLGFRSIINWADQIEIISNDFKVVFDNSFKENILKEKIGYSDEELTIIRKERKLNSDTYPIPLLNSCEISDLDIFHPFTTTISVKYKKSFEGQIIEQLRSISIKTLLFLKNIKRIAIKGNVINNEIAIQRSEIDENTVEVIFDNEKYLIISEDGFVDKDLIDDKESSEPKRFSVKIAYNNELTFSDTVLYNYFKTQIPFDFPFVAHASLELDQNRNHSTESKVNPFILNKLFELQLKLIENLKAINNYSWLPFYCINKHNLNIYLPYIQIIEENWKSLEIFPTFSGIYRSQDSAKTLGESFARFMWENDLGNEYDDQILPCELFSHPEKYISKPFNYVSIIETMADGLEFKVLAKLIKLILECYPTDKFDILLDENKEKILVKEYVYTDKTADNKDLKVPSYSKIRFLHPSLFIALINELGLDLEKDKGRALKDKLEKISDVHSFEPLTVIRKIIRETNDTLNISNEPKKQLIPEFYQTMFHNYFLRRDMPKLDFDGKIPCLNKCGDIRDAKDLTFSEEFEDGSLMVRLFGKLYDDERIMGDLHTFGLQNKDISELEEFFKWIGVNPMAILQLGNSHASWSYKNYINTKHSISISTYELYNIANFEKLLSIGYSSFNNILVWLSLDENIKAIFNNYNSECAGIEKLTYNSRGLKNLTVFQNYIFYRIFHDCQINNYLITNKKEEWFNPFKIDYDYIRNLNHLADRYEIDRILTFFGAKRDFNELSIYYLKGKTNQLADMQNSKGAQPFYKNLVGHYKQNGQKIEDAILYAKQGGEISIKHASEIYFSDRIQLPDSLTNKFPIFYYPSRAGGAMAIELFGLNNLNELDLKILDIVQQNLITAEFEIFIREAAPFILAYRLDKITKEDVKRNQVQRLNKLKIQCCSKIICSISEDVFEIEPYNYIFSNDMFYINIPNNVTLLSLKQNKIFIDNLSEVFLKTFDTLDEKKAFEAVLRQNKEDNLYDVNNDLGEGVLEEARILLGEISIRLSIWKAIFKLNNIIFSAELNESNLEDFITSYFPELKLHILFDSDQTLDEISRIRQTFTLLNIELGDYNGISEYKLSFDKLFQSELREYYATKTKVLKDQFWDFLNRNGSVEDHSSFLKSIFIIENIMEDVVLTQQASNYDFDTIILDKLFSKFGSVPWTLHPSVLPSYDLVSKENCSKFTPEQFMILRRDERLNSLSYFEGYFDEIEESLVRVEKRQDLDFVVLSRDTLETSEFIDKFDVEVEENIDFSDSSNRLWLGNGAESYSGMHNKILGNNVEDIVFDYLLVNSNLYTDVDHVAKTNEAAHYDIKYFDVCSQRIKYVECKYYNGMSFLWSRDEKIFADDHIGDYEIWLVDKARKIFRINDVSKLGNPQVVNYKVTLKLNEHITKKMEISKI